MTTMYIHVKAEDRCYKCIFFDDGDAYEYGTRCELYDEDFDGYTEPSRENEGLPDLPKNCPLERYDSIVIYLDGE